MSRARKRLVAPMEEMYTMGLEVREIAERLGYDRKTVQAALLRAGVHTTDRLGKVRAARQRFKRMQGMSIDAEREGGRPWA